MIIRLQLQQSCTASAVLTPEAAPTKQGLDKEAQQQQELTTNGGILGYSNEQALTLEQVLDLVQEVLVRLGTNKNFIHDMFCLEPHSIEKI